MIDYENLMTLEEAAKKLKVNIETLRRAKRKGKLTVVELGRGYRVSEAELQRYIGSKAEEAK